MAIQSQIVAVPLNQGLDTLTDPKQLAPGRLSSMDNSQYTHLQRVEKRHGYSLVPSASYATGSFTTMAPIQDLYPFNNELLARDKNDRLWSYSQGINAWAYKGQLPRATATAITLVDGPGNYQ